MQHPNYPNDPNIILKPPLWVHDPDQTYDFFYINRMTDLFLLNPDFYHQFPIDLISTSYKSYGCAILFDRATFDNYSWCDQYDVILYNYFKYFSGSDAYRTFDFLPDNLKIEKPALIFPDDFSFNAVRNDLLLQIPPTEHKVVFTWFYKNTDTQWLSETICDKTYQIINPSNSTTPYKLPCSKMLYGSLVISCEDPNVVNQINSQLINGYQYFLYENLSNLLNIFDSQINAYYGDDLYKIPQSVDFKQFYGYKVTTGEWRQIDQYYAQLNDPNLQIPEFLNLNPFLDLTSSAQWTFQDLKDNLVNLGYDPLLAINLINTYSREDFFSDNTQLWRVKEYPLYAAYNILDYPEANATPAFNLQYYNTLLPLMLNVVWQFVPNWYEESCLIFCYPVAENLAHFRISEASDLQSSNIYYDGWWFYFLPPVNLPFSHRRYFEINYSGFARIFSHDENTLFPPNYIYSDHSSFLPNGTPYGPDPLGWIPQYSTFQSAVTFVPYPPFYISGSDSSNIQYQHEYLCYGIRGNFRLGLLNSFGTTGNITYYPNGGSVNQKDKFRLNLYQWNWDDLIFDSHGISSVDWLNNLTDTIIWEKTLFPFDTTGIAEEVHQEIPGTLILSNIQNFSDLQIDYNEIKTDLDFYNNWQNNIMADSQRIKEIHSCLGAGECSNYLDQNGDTKPAKMHLGRLINLMAKTLGINFSLDGKFQKVKPPVKVSKDSLPPGWYLERFGINRGFEPNTNTPKSITTSITIDEQQPGIVYRARANEFITDPVTQKRIAIKEGSYYLCNNLLQQIDLMMDDFDISLDLQNLGAGVLAIGNRSLEYEGLLSLINELHQTTAATNQTVGQTEIVTFVCQQLIKEILKAIGLPGEVKQFTYKLQNGTGEVTKNGKKFTVDEVQIPYHGIAEGSPTILTLFMTILSNIAITNISHLNLKNDGIFKKDNLSKIPKKSFFNLFPSGKEEKNKGFKEYIEEILKDLRQNQKQKDLKDLKDFPSEDDNKNDSIA